MASALKTLEVEEATAVALEGIASAHGVSVAVLLREWLALDQLAPRHETDLAELDARWKAVEGGRPTAGQDEVERWLATWGTPQFRRWHDR